MPSDKPGESQEVADEVRIGWRTFWEADTGGAPDLNLHYWIQGMVTTVDGPLTPEQLTELTG